MFSADVALFKIQKEIREKESSFFEVDEKALANYEDIVAGL